MNGKTTKNPVGWMGCIPYPFNSLIILYFEFLLKLKEELFYFETSFVFFEKKRIWGVIAMSEI